ncbi:phytanoyl-CoA dioxygenase family protein [Bacillus mangrovi]|uniref:Phytanoyl-CoA dioxygenase family protein n=1 Tax=Metabacillus mangrovi TaxID=1491830 RepID=A0A7X2S9C6_9BACI|nr:phytanoyl-CoA dioxygenase family protein [Metabacillus mangrovi]MTH55613.1 phytanoyl-CoA dioxygenase family protein [Metabacillus mangrovi]
MDQTKVLPELTSSYDLTEEQIKEYQNLGHICLRGVASEEEMKAYRDVIYQKTQEKTGQLAPLSERDTYGKAFVQVMNLWEHSEDVKKFVMAQRYAKIAAELLGVDGVRIYHDQALFKEPGGGHTPWHQDQTYWPIDTDKTITMWMPLVDVSEEMGSMSFASESHKRGYISKLGISDESHQTLGEYIDAEGLEKVTHGAMKAGDATFHYGWTLHSAPGNPTDRTREVMTIIYMADGTKVSEIDHEARANDLKQWMPGLKTGDLVDSPLNPLVYSATK